MARDLAVDLGTANTLVYARGRGVIVDEPTLIALNERTGDVVAIGGETWDAVAASPGFVVAVRPLRHGTITDFEVTERLIRMVLHRAGSRRLLHPRVLIAVSSAITPVERRAVEEAATAAGARSVHLIEEAMAAATGAGLPVDQPAGNCVVDVGGGTTEIAVISMGSIVAGRSIKTGGFDLDEAIRDHLARVYGVSVGERTAEAIKREIGSAAPYPDAPAAEVRGREIATGTPCTIEVHGSELVEALDPSITAIVEAIRATLAETPPDLAHDVIARGIVLTGGGGMLRGLDQRLSDETGITVRLAPEPLQTVAVGAGRALASMDRLRRSRSGVE